MEIFKLFGFQKQCPCCQQTFTKISKYQKMLFCPHCEHLLIETHQSKCNQGIDTSLLKQAVLSFVWAIIFTLPLALFRYYGDSLPFLFEFGLVISLVTLLFLFGAIIAHRGMNKTFISTIDTLESIKQDNEFYETYALSEDYSCQNCHSHRLVSLFNYKLIRKRNEKGIFQKYEHLDEKRHIGCLNCYTIFKVKTETNQASMSANDKWKFFLFCLLSIASIFSFLYMDNWLPPLPKELMDLPFLFFLMWLGSFNMYQPNSNLPYFTEKYQFIKVVDTK